MGGEIRMDWSQAMITVGKQRVLLHPETKAKYIVFSSNDVKAQILYQDCGFGNYMISTDPQDESMLTDSSMSDALWSIEFDGSCSSSELGVRVVLIPPHGKVIPYSFKLEFQNMNNTAQYEALLLGLAEARRMQIKKLKVRGDTELIVKQVRGLFAIKNERLRHYRNHVWDEIEAFDAFSIEVIPREFNSKADSLAVSIAFLVPHPDFTTDTYMVELVYRPSVPDNSESWQVFENDK
ncbi:uncharacterized protein LOC131858754 [Cryptomeria japonica]|uniref:uncharacterized protein LOC131858754 n=1 Tax=Cryptomeria japonica TaxID=3369 RepID=UPI0027DA68EE|nr:uncharacterized protein LOC131858754 [Cryptomeria japonica]